MVILTDDSRHQRQMPTKNNIVGKFPVLEDYIMNSL